MGAHIAGPWEADRHTDGDGPTGYYSIEAAVLHRHGPVADTLNRDHCISPEEDRANAILMAAAPELLAALVEAEKMILALAYHVTDIEALMQIRAAIAKANQS